MDCKKATAVAAQRSSGAPEHFEEDSSTQWAGKQDCYGANQILISFLMTLTAPLISFVSISSSLFPLILSLHNFYSNHNPGALCSEISFRQVQVYDLLSTFVRPSSISSHLLWRCVLVATHVIFRSTTSVGDASVLVILPPLFFLFL